MAIHKSAIKRARQNVKRKAHNRGYKDKVKEAIKSVLSAVETKKSKKAKEELQKTTKIIYSIASKGILHKKTASRKVGRLTKLVNKLS